MNKLQSILKILVKWLYKQAVKLFSVKQGIIIFESNLGRNYSGNPKAIYEKMIEMNLHESYQFIWCFANPQIYQAKPIFQGKATLVKRLGIRYLYYFLIAQVWIFDCREPQFLIKRPEVYYLQTWHGTPLKKLALDMAKLNMGGETNLADYYAGFKISSAKWDYLLTQNSFSSKIFPRCFDFKGAVLEFGYPRNDILFFDNNIEHILTVKEKLQLPLNKKILLYAPTWRDNQFFNNQKYKFASKLNFSALQKKMGEDYIVLVKYHYLVEDLIDWSSYENFVYRYGAEQDIAELYLVSDMLITDYSSVMFDYSILKRPIFYFAYDLKEYQQELRGFYLNYLQEMPGPISENTDELIKEIQHYNPEKWRKKQKDFRKKFNQREDGHASERTVDFICNLLVNTK